MQPSETRRGVGAKQWGQMKTWEVIEREGAGIRQSQGVGCDPGVKGSKRESIGHARDMSAV